MNTAPESEPISPQAKDALSNHVLPVSAEARPAEILREVTTRCTKHFAVFAHDRFLGLVNPQDAFRSSPLRIFADLLPQNLPPPVLPDAPVADLLRTMERFDTDALPVVDSNGGFVGTVTKESLFQALRDYQQRLNAALASEREQRAQLSAQLMHELQATEGHYRSIFENAQEGIFQTTPEGRFQATNPALARMLGYASPEELIASVTDIARQIYVNADQRAEFRRMIEEQGTVRGYELEAYCKDGSRRWLRESGRLVRDTQGNALYYEGILEDITDQKQAEQENRLLLTLAKSVAEAGSFESALTFALYMVCESTGWDYGEVWIPSRDGTSLELGSPYYCRARDAESFHSVSKGFEFAPGMGLPGRVWASRNPAWIPDVTADANFPRASFAREVGIKAAVAVPILADDTVVAVTVFFLREARQEDPRMVALVAAIAAQLGTAFQRRQAEDTVRRRTQELEALAEVASALRLAQTRDEMLPLLVAKTMEMLRADAGALILLVDETLLFAAARGPAEALLGQCHLPADDPLWQVVRSGQPLFIADVSEQGEFIRSETCRMLMSDLRACACVPLKAAETTIGLVHLACRSRRVATEDEIRLLTSIAEMAGNALHRASLHEQTQRDALALAVAYDATIEGWAHALELRDRETEGHTRRVTEMTLQLARASGMGEDELIHIRRGALLHDIGKMGIPDRILLKPDKLTDEEWDIMRKHPLYAYEMLYTVQYLRPALHIPYCHHEKWDGSGYPRGLKGEEIPLAARLFAVVDVWDALRSDRPYRQGWLEEQVREYIRAQAGAHFDPKAVELFFQVLI